MKNIKKFGEFINEKFLGINSQLEENVISWWEEMRKEFTTDQEAIDSLIIAFAVSNADISEDEVIKILKNNEFDINIEMSESHIYKTPSKRFIDSNKEEIIKKISQRTKKTHKNLTDEKLDDIVKKLNNSEQLTNNEFITLQNCGIINKQANKSTKYSNENIIKKISAEIESGEYEHFPSTKNRLKEISDKLKKNIELSNNDLYTLKACDIFNDKIEEKSVSVNEVKTFNKGYLPNTIEHDGKTYKREDYSSHEYGKDIGFFIKKLASKNKDKSYIQVNVLSHNLKGREDLHGKKYEPTKWIFSAPKKLNEKLKQSISDTDFFIINKIVKRIKEGGITFKNYTKKEAGAILDKFPNGNSMKKKLNEFEDEIKLQLEFRVNEAEQTDVHLATKAYKTFDEKKYTLYKSGSKKVVEDYIKKYGIPKNASYKKIEVGGEYRLYLYFNKKLTESALSFDENEPNLILDESRGIYIPQAFSEIYADKIINAQDLEDDREMLWALEEIKNPDNENYWEAWQEILDKAILEIDGKRFTLYQDGDVWLVPEGYDIEKFFQ